MRKEAIPVEPELEDVDPEHGLGAVRQVLLLIVFLHGYLVLLVPRLLLLQLLRLLHTASQTRVNIEATSYIVLII